MPNTIAQNLERLQDARDDIASAITNMGGTVTSGDGFEEFPADIATIPTGATIIPLSSSSGDANAKVYAVYHDGMLSVFGSDRKGSAFGTSVTYTFPSSLADIGVQDTLSGVAITKNSVGTQTADVSLEPNSTSFSVSIKSGSPSYNFNLSGVFTPTT